MKVNNILTGFRFLQNYNIYNPPTTDGYPVPFTLNYIPGGDPFFRDIIPVANGEILPFWIEHAAGTPFTSPKIWVRLPIGCKQVEIYRNNPKMTADRSDENRTFDFFDDFITLNTNIWTLTNTPSISSPSVVRMTAEGNSQEITSKVAFPINTCLEWYGQTSHWDRNTSGIGFVFCGFRDASVNLHQFYQSGTSNYGKTLRNCDGTSTFQDVASCGYIAATWQRSRINRKSDRSTLQIGTNTSIDNTEHYPTGSLPILCGVSNSGITIYNDIDWILARKYQSPEPSYILQSTKTNPLWRGG